METISTPLRPGTATDEPVPSVHFATDVEAKAYRAGIAEGLRRARGRDREAAAVPDFDPVPLRYRRDGWTPEAQVGFIRALAECGCVVEACRRVGRSTEGAYELARRPDAQSFRIAWDIAMDNAVRRVGDGAFSRALNGVEIPHFYKGELVGTHRRWDERLTMFILRTRDPLRFGREVEKSEPVGCREDKALELADALAWSEADAHRENRGRPRTVYTNFGREEDDEPQRFRDPAIIYAFAPGLEVVADGEPAQGEFGEDDEEERDRLNTSPVQGEARPALEKGRTRARSAWEGEGPPPLEERVPEPPPAPDVARTSSTSEPGHPDDDED